MTEPVEDLGHLPAPSQIEAMAGYGLSAAEIARVFQVDVELLKSAHSQELEAGAIKANARVAESLYRKAIGDGRESVTAAIFWLKTRARWKETSVHEQRFTHDDFILSLDEGAKRFTSKIEEMAARDSR